MRGARDLIPLLVPLLTLGLERAITLSEAMESRGFGAPPRPGVATTGWQRAGTTVGLASAATAGYFLAVGRPVAGLVTLAVGLGLIVVGLRGGESPRTSYRTPTLTRRDWLVLASSLLSLFVMVVVLSLDPESLRYEPYPSIEIPRVNLALLIAIGALLSPAVVVPKVSSSPTSPHPQQLSRNPGEGSRLVVPSPLRGRGWPVGPGEGNPGEQNP
jgi:hypothetical protein